MRLEGCTALVTGANRGIGRAIAEALAAAGVRVLAGVRELDGGHDVPSPLEAVRMDLSSPEAVDSSVDGLSALPDLLVNNAGRFAGGLLERQDPDHLQEVLQVNLAAPIRLTRRLLPGMLERGSGKIVNNVSIIGHAPFPGATVYAASKTGLAGFTDSLRRELQDTPVSVLELVTPGVDTEMMDQVQEELSGHSKTDNWDHVDPADWAEKVVKAISDDEDRLNPGGAERVAQLMPDKLLSLVAKGGFER